MHPILFEIGPVRIASYGTMMALGFLVGIFILRRELSRKGIDAAMADRIAIAAMLGGVVGAKVYHLIENFGQTLQDPIGTVFSGTGLAWYGGLAGGTAAVVWTLHRHGCLELRVLDAMAPALVSGYFFGRGGCQLSGDGCYGVPTDLPWGMAYPNGTVPTLAHVHPAPVYEMLEMALVFAIVWRLRTHIRTPGVLFCIYLFMVGAARFVVEYVRLNPEAALGLTMHQWISLGMAIGAPVWAVWLLKRRSEGVQE